MTLNTEENANEIIRLRNEEHLSWRSVAETMGISTPYAINIYKEHQGDREPGAPSTFRDDNSSRTSEVLRMRDEEGMTLDEIGRMLGITRERVRQIYTRGGGKQRGYPQFLRADPVYCMDCGGQLMNGKRARGITAKRCKDCYKVWHSKNRKFWNEETVVAAIHKFRERYGRWPVSTDFNPGTAIAQSHPEVAERFHTDSDYPYINTVRSVFGSWNNALLAAGRPEEELYKTNSKAFNDPLAIERTIQFIEAGLTYREISELEGISIQGVEMRVKLYISGVPRRALIDGELKQEYVNKIIDGEMTIGQAAREIETTYCVVSSWVAGEKFTRKYEAAKANGSAPTSDS